MLKCTFVLFLLTVAASPWRVATAEPFTPTDDNLVLQLVRDSAVASGELRAVKQLRIELEADPQNLDRATDLARRYIVLGRRLGDPRYHGYAQAVLRPWWQQSEPPEPVLILRATLRQNRHDFDGALDDLRTLLTANPSHAQGWLTRAVIHQVRGEYAEAGESCVKVMRYGNPLLAATCAATTISLNGRARAGYELLQKAVRSQRRSAPQERLWALVALAEIAERLGDAAAAEHHFRQALALGEYDVYLLSAFVDFLLAQGRASEVRALLVDETRVDGLLLRLALAEKTLSAPELGAHQQALRARFTAVRMRGVDTHLASESRFNLYLDDNPQRALELAKKNWMVQKQPSDTRLLLEAALAGGDREAAQQALDWLANTGLEDVRLQALVANVEGHSR